MEKHSYLQYLKIEELLSCQEEITESEDELLFIVIHQSQELWFKLIIHELRQAIRILRGGHDRRAAMMAYKKLARVSQIQRHLVDMWDILATLTPDEYLTFRESVGKEGASGFQSYQYRQVEYLLGSKYSNKKLEKSGKTPDETLIEEHDFIAKAENGKIQSDLLKALNDPSVYDATVMFLNEMLPALNIRLRSDAEYCHPYVKSEEVFRAWEYIYKNRENEPQLFQLGEKLVDLEDTFRQWKFRHLGAVARVIGSNTGTGGSTGLRYLRGVALEAMDNPIYPELWDLRHKIFSNAFDMKKHGY